MNSGCTDLVAIEITTIKGSCAAAPAGYNLLPVPVEITVSGDCVSYSQSGNVLQMCKDGVSFNQGTETYTLVITNDAGYEIPSTKGLRISRFRLLDRMIILLAGAGMVLLSIKRRAGGSVEP